MTDREIDESVAKMEAFRKELVKSKEKCVQFLIKLGIFNPDGTFNDRYANLPRLMNLHQEGESESGSR
jgi:hypothetical protein